jgi:ribosomal protein L11 methyltransferase
MNIRAHFWWAIRIEITEKTLEPISNFLFEIGSVGCLEQEDQVIAYFPGDQDVEVLRSEVEAYLSQLPELGLADRIPEIVVERTEDRDWNSNWKAGLGPIHVSGRLVVKPTWEAYTPAPGEIVIEVDPKQAFGTGTHATTQLCLRAIERVIRGDEQLLDIGTGTGVLAIAAVKLGGHRALGIDIDPVALEAAQENVVVNQVEGKVELRVGRLPDLPPQAFDVVVANLNRSIIEVEVLPQLQRFTGPESWVILSGILREEIDRFLDEVKRNGLVLEALETQDEWVAALVRLPGEDSSKQSSQHRQEEH